MKIRQKIKKIFSIEIDVEKLIIDKSDNKFSVVDIITAIVDADDNADCNDAVIIC